ncbi:replicative DNA helicase [Aggregatibacter actinomycetemcomitans]|uniref:replicative DNA helicase n=1 Tax=Aggregatibacter actinomycetemcomitans TaxID=714 RepID=UPI00197C7796|nr:replicative DNA helicase [Aggregatibacter actinomycetemcomitans]MBN6077304.1 replicative DNA helicase [Aggregatibacter actinomycetemcomitans]
MTKEKPNKIKANPVYSAEAEAAVLGSLIIKNDTFDEISTLVCADDFFSYIHKIIFEGIVHLLQLGKPVDILTLEQHFKDKELIDEFGFAYLAQIVDTTPSAANIVAYAKIVARHSKQRRFLQLGQFIMHEMQSSKDDMQLEVFEEEIDKQYTNITVNQEKDNVANLGETFEKILTQMELSSISADPVSGTPTGIVELDNITTGGQPGDLIIVAARPAMGKTAFAQLIAQSTLDKYTDAPIQFYSQEMPAEQLVQRFMSMRSRISLQSIRQATELTEPEWAKVSEAMGYIMNNWQDRLLIDDEPSLSPYRLRAKVRKNTRLYGKPKAIIIDYIQLMRSSGKFENRNLELAEISSDLKKLAKETGCPVYALSQLNRSLEQRANKRPINSDLRDSGSLEQDADAIFHLYRDEVYNPQTEARGMVEIIIGKQRNGPLATVNAQFLGQYSLFENISSKDSYHE